MKITSINSAMTLWIKIKKNECYYRHKCLPPYYVLMIYLIFFCYHLSTFWFPYTVFIPYLIALLYIYIFLLPCNYHRLNKKFLTVSFVHLQLMSIKNERPSAKKLVVCLYPLLSFYIYIYTKRLKITTALYIVKACFYLLSFIYIYI